MNRKILIFFSLLAILIIGIAIYQVGIPAKLNGGIIDPPKPMPGFTLQSTHGSVKLNDFRGKIVVVFFGFTNCTDVCPLTLAALREAFNTLGDQAKNVQVLFISVDYGRDTPEIVGGYTSNFRPDFIGLTGSKNEIDQVTQDFGIYYKLLEPGEESQDHAHTDESADGADSHANQNYEVEHTTTIQVLDRQGNLILTWPYGLTPQEMASDLKVLIKR